MEIFKEFFSADPVNLIEQNFAFVLDIIPRV